VSGDPCLKFLGVPETSAPTDLLGLPLGEINVATVEAALLDRIDIVFSHADARADEARHVRQVLRDAAWAVLAGLRETRAPPRRPRDVQAPVVTLTEFDRHVLAVLIGCGGWNTESRMRLVSLAADYAVSVQGLLRVMTGLSAYARSGGPRLDVAAITEGLDGPVQPAAGAAADQASAKQWIDRLTPELRDKTPRSTLKLAVLFGLLTIFCGTIVYRVLFVTVPAPPPQVDVSPRPRVEAPPGAATPQPPAPIRQRPASFSETPTFQGQALTAEAAAAADNCPQLVGEIELIGRKIAIADEPSEAVYRGWDVSLETAATGWVLVDQRLLEHISEAILEGLYAASDSPSVTDRLLLSLTPPSRRLDEAVDVWRGAWITATLATVASSRGLPPAVVQRARIQLDLAIGGPLQPGGDPFRAGAGAWLDQIAATLVDAMEFNPQTYDLWEFWIAAQRRLGRGERFDEALMNAIELILLTSTDLARAGPSVNVLGRLVSLADFRSSPVVRDRFLSMFGEDSGIDSRDLWVISSLLTNGAATAWFGADLVLAEDADWMLRRRIADRIGDRWPPEATAGREHVARVRGIPVDPELAARWLTVFEQIEALAPSTNDEDRVAALLTASRLNEIAVRLSVGDADEATRQLDLLERGAPPAPLPKSAGPSTGFRPRPPRGPAPVGAPGSPGAGAGRDGVWAVAYEDAGRRGDERLNLLASLRDAPGDDLGPVDAEVFVRAVYRAMPAEVRTLAREILTDRLSGGPTVAMELLDQFPGTPRTQATSDLIRRVTGWRLPTARSESWPVDARLALVRHVIALVSPANTVDELMEAVRDSYDSRRSCLDSNWMPSQRAAPAAAELAEAWRQRALAVTTRVRYRVPGDEAEIQRRHATRLRLADGPLQMFVASQLALLDQMAYMAVADQAGLRDPAIGVLIDSARRRSRMSHVLAQAVEAERAMNRLWRLQIAVTEPGGQSRRGRGGLSAPVIVHRLAKHRGRQAAPATITRAVLLVLVCGLAVPGDGAAEPGPWTDRVETLDPADPMAYFELAEEIADASAGGPRRDLARHLFALSGVLDPQRLGRSACLALADLEADQHSRRRLLALAALLDERAGGGIGGPAGETRYYDRASVLAVTNALSFYRTGNGAKAVTALRTPSAKKILDAHDTIFRGGAERFIEECRLYRGSRRPVLAEADRILQLKFEAALLAGDDRSWSGELLLNGGRPLIEVDPDRLESSFGVDAGQACYRGGRWQGCE